MLLTKLHDSLIQGCNIHTYPLSTCGKDTSPKVIPFTGGHKHRELYSSVLNITYLKYYRSTEDKNQWSRDREARYNYRRIILEELSALKL
jgi:hypothetical protein